MQIVHAFALGVDGQPLKLMVKNDAFDPVRTANNIRSLFTQDHVSAVLYTVGTNATLLAAPIASEYNSFVFAPSTGSSVVHKGEIRKNLFFLQSTYGNEIFHVVKSLLKKGLKPEELALYSQGDAIGEAFYQGVIQVFHALGHTDVTELTQGRYHRDRSDVTGALADILDADVEPRVVLILAHPEKMSPFIRLVKEELNDVLFISLSAAYSATSTIAPDLQEGLVIVQHTPAYTADLPGVEAYRQDLAAYDPNQSPTQSGLYTYLGGKILHRALQAAKASDAASIRQSLEQMGVVDLGIGEPINLKSEQRPVWATVLRGGQFHSLDWDALPIPPKAE